jgi:hypothetical protein
MRIRSEFVVTARWVSESEVDGEEDDGEER